MKEGRRIIMCKKLFLVVSFLLVFSLVVNASGQPTDQIMYEVWENIGGTAVSDLTNNPNYPDNPTSATLLSDFHAPVGGDEHNNFGGRIHGYLYVENSGDYTFWIASDDASELWLSTDDNPDNAVLIASVSGWTNDQDWDGTSGAPGPNQKSAPIALEGGGKYYISAIYKEGGGGDNCSVAWQGPDHPERVLLAGHHLSPAPWALSVQKAQNPDPADGAVDVVKTTLDWTMGALAVSNAVYLNGELIAETEQTFASVTLDPGATYTWQVNEIQEDGTVIEGDVWTFTTLPLEAHLPSPADGAEDIKSPITLSWVAGKSTVFNLLYFGNDKALVEARDPSTAKGNIIQTSYAAPALELFSTYYWAVDEFTPAGTVPGPVWSFSTEKYLSILTGQKSLTYDNTAEPYVSEMAFDVPADLTVGGIVADLTLNFQGQADNLSVDEATGTYEIAGSGADIWGNSDQFHYVYMTLNGDGEISARVVSNGTGSNTWAKGGVMIRETDAPNSKHMIMAMTGGDGGGICFQGRFVDTGAASSSLNGDLTAAPPYWVKLTREGNTITAYSSADGETWDLFTDTSPDNSGGNISNPIDVEMADPVLIGLFVTSHAAGEVRTFTFDNVNIVGDVSGELVSEDIDSVSGNSAQPIYVSLEDSAGAVATVAHPDAAATQITAMRNWTIPLSKFEGVDPTAAMKLYVGVGNGEPDGVGVLNVADIRVIEPDRTAAIASWQAAASAASPVFIATNVADGAYDIGSYGGEQTYEFVVRSNPTETEPSMCLIGRRDSGETNAGLKYEQWQNTGTYGATLFGVVDLDFGVANDPGVDTDIVFVSSEASGTTALYVNGVYQASVDNAISLSGTVGIGYGIQDPNLHAGVGTFDNFDGVIYGVAIYDAALSDEEIAAHSAAFSAPVTDVTVPSDIIQGVPNDGDWPAAEAPANAFDNNVNTKYLHFKGDFDPDPGTGGAGLRITPLDGPSVVTGLTFTTANDTPGRDPIAFELSGSNDSIDGPYTLIASGDIVDFAGETEWPRFTKNETPITFDNSTAYANYQLIFTAIRGPVGGSVNSMQIAEVELLGVR
jgi:hypothetical protein